MTIGLFSLVVPIRIASIPLAFEERSVFDVVHGNKGEKVFIPLKATISNFCHNVPERLACRNLGDPIFRYYSESHGGSSEPVRAARWDNPNTFRYIHNVILGDVFVHNYLWCCRTNESFYSSHNVAGGRSPDVYNLNLNNRVWLVGIDFFYDVYAFQSKIRAFRYSENSFAVFQAFRAYISLSLARFQARSHIYSLSDRHSSLTLGLFKLVFSHLSLFRHFGFLILHNPNHFSSAYGINYDDKQRNNREDANHNDIGSVRVGGDKSVSGDGENTQNTGGDHRSEPIVRYPFLERILLGLYVGCILVMLFILFHISRRINDSK